MNMHSVFKLVFLGSAAFNYRCQCQHEQYPSYISFRNTPFAVFKSHALMSQNLILLWSNVSNVISQIFCQTRDAFCQLTLFSNILCLSSYTQPAPEQNKWLYNVPLCVNLIKTRYSICKLHLNKPKKGSHPDKLWASKSKCHLWKLESQPEPRLMQC